MAVLDGLDEDNRVRVKDIKKAATTTTYVAVTSTVDIGQMINKEMLAFPEAFNMKRELKRNVR